MIAYAILHFLDICVYHLFIPIVICTYCWRASLDDVSKISIMASFMKGSARLIRNNKVAIVDKCFYNLYRRSMLDLQDYLNLYCDTYMAFFA